MFFSFTIHATLSFINPGGGGPVWRQDIHIQGFTKRSACMGSKTNRLLGICYPVSLRDGQLTRYNTEKRVVQPKSTIKNINDPNKAN